MTKERRRVTVLLDMYPVEPGTGDEGYGVAQMVVGGKMPPSVGGTVRNKVEVDVWVPVVSEVVIVGRVEAVEVLQ